MPPALIYSLMLGTVALLLALVAVLRAERLTSPVRFMASLVFAPLACFCVFGFGAAFEPGDYHVVWRLVYAVTFLACVAALVRLGVAGRRDRNRPEGD
jgi:peptidoglycan/LPS O-acetylase OafA/YrhL